MKKALIIFVRNPLPGKVKTRLAAGIGDEKALQVYEHLLFHTKSVVDEVPVDKIVYYADYIDSDDMWNGFEKKLQLGDDLGMRMMHAFEEQFDAGYNSICIIGSDCLELNSEIATGAFDLLEYNDLVVGPVTDGGYYLLGMNKLEPQLFSGKAWSTASVYADTLKDAGKLKLTVSQLPVLHDIDNINDLRNSSLAFFV